MFEGSFSWLQSLLLSMSGGTPDEFLKSQAKRNNKQPLAETKEHISGVLLD